MTSEYLFVFADNMLSNISKTELSERARKMRVAVSMNNDSLLQKRNTPTIVAQVQSDQDEHTTLEPFFKRKRSVAAPPIEHSHLNGRALN